MKLTLESATAARTAEIGEALGRACTSQVAFLLAGEYGSGKTTFIQGLARGLGVSEPVRSPSYNILKIYGGAGQSLLHADLYRTNSTADINELGIMELLPAAGILAVEWPGLLSQIGTGLPEVRISFGYPADGPNGDGADAPRSLDFELDGECPDGIREAINALAAG